MVQLGSELPFQRAVQVLDHLTGVQVSEGTLQRWTEAIGQEVVAETDRVSQQLYDQLPTPQGYPHQKVVTVDGAFVPVKGGWNEMKLVVIGEPVTDDHQQVHLQNLHYTARITDCETMTHLCYPAFHQQGVDGAEAVAVVSDGSEWIQTLMDAHREDAVRILDAMHACQRFATISTTLFAEESVAKRWYTKYRQRLLDGRVEWILPRLHWWSQRFPAIGGDVLYLQKRQDMLRYPLFTAAQWPIGSGSVESGHRHIMQRRLKGPGMHWEIAHANALLSLRCLTANGQWEEELPKALERYRQSCISLRRTRHQARHIAPASIPKELSSPLPHDLSSSQVSEPPSMPVSLVPRDSSPVRCPSAHHPWRQYHHSSNQSSSSAIK